MKSSFVVAGLVFCIGAAVPVIGRASPGVLSRKPPARSRSHGRRPRRARRGSGPSVRQLKVWGMQMYLGQGPGRAVVSMEKRVSRKVDVLWKRVNAFKAKTGKPLSWIFTNFFIMGTLTAKPLGRLLAGGRRLLSSDMVECSAIVRIAHISVPRYGLLCEVWGRDVAGVFGQLAVSTRSVATTARHNELFRRKEKMTLRALGLVPGRSYLVGMEVHEKGMQERGIVLARSTVLTAPKPYERFLVAPFPVARGAKHMVRDESIKVFSRVAGSGGRSYLKIRVRVPDRFVGAGGWLVVEARGGHGDGRRGFDAWTEFRYALPLNRGTWAFGSPATTAIDASRSSRGRASRWIHVRAAVVRSGRIRINGLKLVWSPARRRWQ